MSTYPKRQRLFEDYLRVRYENHSKSIKVLNLRRKNINETVETIKDRWFQTNQRNNEERSMAIPDKNFTAVH